jgi:hypothetical protein
VFAADNLPHSSADVTECGSLNLPEPSGPHRPVMGLLYFTLSLLLKFQIPGTYKLCFVFLSLRTPVQSAESFRSLGTKFSCYVDRTRELEVPEILMSSVLFISLQFLRTIFAIATKTRAHSNSLFLQYLICQQTFARTDLQDY